MAIDTKWRGTSAGIKWVLLLLIVTSFACWAIGLAFAVRLMRLSTSYRPFSYRSSTPSDAELFFYSAALPMASLLASVIDLVLFFNNLLHPIVSIVWGIAQFGVWIYMLTTWSVCEYSPDLGSDGCPNFFVYSYSPRRRVYRSGEWMGRLATGGIAAALALTQMSLAARAVDLARRERKATTRKEAA